MSFRQCLETSASPLSSVFSSRISSRRGTSSRRQAEQGAMLIIALGVLALMVILATAFAQLMRLEKKATENYVEATRMDMLLDSALDRAIAQLQGAVNYKSFTVYSESPPWLYLVRREGDLANGRMDVEDDRVGTWEIFAEQVGQNYSYKPKIIDCAAQIDLNGRQDTLARMLDNLGMAIEKSTRLKLDGKHVTNPFYTEPNRAGNQVRGYNIVQVRMRLPGGKFTSKTQLKQMIGPENYDAVKDFVTVRSWEDPDTYKPTDGEDEVIDPMGLGSVGAVGAGRGVGGGSVGMPQPDAYMATPRLDAEPRHPININTAPEEVLVAAIQGVACRRLFPFSKLGAGGSMVPVDQNANILGQRIVAQEEYRDVTPRPIFVYAPMLEYDHAKRIADKIIAQRKIRPFMTWRTNNEAGMQGFEDFVDQLDAGYFPSPGLCQVVDPDMPQNRAIQGQVMSGGTSPISRLWVKGHATGAERQLRRQFGLTMHDQYAWYYDMIKGGLKANFNPNTRISRYNPNAPAYVPVDKSDLVYLSRDRVRLLKGHTTEFCFDTNGIFEITALARITRAEDQRARTTPSALASSAFARPVYEKKIRSVVQIFGQLRHTSQLHFEKNFQSQGRSSKRDRKYVVTWPEPMAALTELVSGGSKRDGRVELAGLNDGIRLEMPVQMRLQYFRNFQSVILGLGFQDRDGQSLADLKRIRTGGMQSLLTDTYSQTMRDVLNGYSRFGSSKYCKFYRIAELRQITAFKNTNASWYDPLVDKEDIGSDVFPDGLSTSISRMTHLGLRHLVVPARSRIGDSSESSGNALVGESGRGSRTQNVKGNVPYHKGGIAFWLKFEFNGDDPVFSGLIGCTQVITSVKPSAADYTGSEGTQFFIFKNSIGELRVVRMYYHQAFLEAVGGDSGSSSSDSEGYRLFPDPGVKDASGGAAGAAGTQNPILNELDPRKLVSRSDIVFDIKHFKAHEWHHVALEWDDENVAYPIKLYLDFQEVREAQPRMAQALLDATSNSWVRLNERQPKDGLQLNGIVRDQGVMDAGVFKWFTNTASLTGGGGVQPVAQSTKRIIGNATIDEVITFEGNFPSARQFYGGRASPGYFSTQPGEYANVFEVPLPPNVEQIVLRSFDWTSYYPTMYTDSRLNSVAQAFPQKTPITCRLFFRSDGTPPAEFSEPWRNPTVANLVAGRKALSASGSLIDRRKAEVVYLFTMIGARPQVGNAAGGVVQTPVIDDVTLTYFLPHPRILAQEEED